MRCLVLCVGLVVYSVHGAPRGRQIDETLPANLLTLPSNATSIRANIDDSFSCEGRSYGYYADVENDCQLFHVCLPVTYASGRSQMFRWSFICPDETVFNQEMFTCARSDDSIDCLESPRFYKLNRNFGDQLNIALPTDETQEEHDKQDPHFELEKHVAIQEQEDQVSALEESQQGQQDPDVEEEEVTVPLVAQELDALQETISESAEVAQMTHVTHAQEYMKTTVPIVPIYYRSIRKN